MISFPSFRAGTLRCAMTATLLLVSVRAARAQYDPDWARNFRVGVLTGFNIKADFRTTGGSFPISGRGPGPLGVSGEEHFFDDGYVRVNNPPNDQGLTWNWGYENDNQYQGDRMLFHHTSSFSDSSGSSKQEDDSPYVGFDLAYGGMLWHKSWVRVGWEFGFGFLPVSISQDITPHEVMANRSTYAFNLGGVIPPDAPYNGSATGPGPLLEDQAALVGSGEDTAATLSGDRTLDVSLFVFRLGPSVFFDLTPRWGVSISGGPAMGLVTGSYDFSERLSFGEDDSIARNRGSISDTSIVYGGYVSGTVTYHAVPNGDIYLSVQYTPLGSATIGGGGREARLDLGGALFVSAGINWPF